MLCLLVWAIVGIAEPQTIDPKPVQAPSFAA
jgi:hypothetical protein